MMTLTIGTRRSLLAMAQTRMVSDSIRASAPDVTIEQKAWKSAGFVRAHMHHVTARKKPFLISSSDCPSPSSGFWA